MKNITVKSILNKKKQRDSWFLDDYTVNAYSGCSFNCLFCYIRGSKYGENMEEKFSYKENALEILERQLHNRAKKNEHGIIVVSSATEPYNHFEEELKLTRGILELILKYRFPVHIITRSNLVERDFDLLHDIGERAIIPADLQSKLKSGTIITFSFTTVSDAIAAIFEPGATPPQMRISAMKETSDAGFITGVSMMPLLPWISDTGAHLEEMFSEFKKHGTHYVMPASLTLFGNTNADSKTLVFRAIKKHYPELIQKYEKYFAGSNEMPRYYAKALYEKTLELGMKYGLRNRII